jgi:hypothetical protein
MSGIIIFCRVVQKLDASIHLSARGTTYSKQNYEIIVLQEIHISKLEQQRWPLELVISLSNVYIWDLGLRLGSFLLGL